MTNVDRTRRALTLRVSAFALTLGALGVACTSSDPGTAENSAGNGGSSGKAGAQSGGTAGTAGASPGGASGSAGDASGAGNAGNAGAGGSPGPTGPVLTGDPAAPAAGALTNLDPTPSDPADIVDDLILSKLDLWLAPGATVAQVNAALAAIGGGIAYMQEGGPALTVSFPPVADEASLEAKRQLLASEPGVLFAARAEVPDPESLPPSPADASANLGYLFASKFPAAWNLSSIATKGCELRKVPLWVTDFFPATPLPNFETEVPDFEVTDTKPSDVPHGYRVTAIAAAQFDANPMTGANPFTQCLDIHGIRIDNFSPLERNGVIAKAFDSRKGIVNGSFGHPIPGCKKTGCVPETFQNKGELIDAWVLRAADWRRETVQFDNDLLFVAAAGNTRVQDAGIRYQMFRDARIAGEMAMASSPQIFGSSRLGIFDDAGYFAPDGNYSDYPSLARPASVVQALKTAVNLILDSDVTTADNVVIVGSTTASMQESTFSNADPDVHAVGEDVREVDGDTGSGTSYSAPQVAGLASYLWLLSNDLRTQPARFTRQAIVENSVVPSNAPAVRQLDAFASVLSLDPTDNPPSPQATPIRLALLDVNNDGVFDENDIAEFADAYIGLADEPVQTWGRLDLNGDGYVGGSKKARFDLDPQGSTQYGAGKYTGVFKTIDGHVLEFDENAVSDLEVLCYYANSDLFTGNASAREGYIQTACNALTPRPTDCPVGDFPLGRGCFGATCCPQYSCGVAPECVRTGGYGPGCAVCQWPTQ